MLADAVAVAVVAVDVDVAFEGFPVLSVLNSDSFATPVPESNCSVVVASSFSFFPVLSVYFAELKVRSVFSFEYSFVSFEY